MGHKKGLLIVPECPAVTSKWHPSSQLYDFSTVLLDDFWQGSKIGAFSWETCQRNADTLMLH